MGVAARPIAKVDQARALASQIAYGLGPAARMPTFVDLCAQARVSKATMDAALGQLETEGILSRRQGAGIFVSPNLRQGIALVCDPQFSIDPRLQGFWELIVSEARLRVAGTHYDLSFHFSSLASDIAGDSPALHPGLIDDLQSGRVQGVLTVGLPPQTLKWLDHLGVATVAFAGEGSVSVNLDSVDIVELGVGALAERGCRRLALWLEPSREDEEAHRTEMTAFRGALSSRGLEFCPEWVRPKAHETRDLSYFERVLEWSAATFSTPRSSWPDGLLITNDHLTREAMLALQRLGILPNRDIVIASHANTGSPVLRAYEDNLILIEFDSGEIVKTMFDRLETLLKGEPLTSPHVRIRPKVRTSGRS